jgi:alpha-D-ribose 1-methylphosphonate 5-triphosphate synthase subunit PhnH
MRKPGEVGNATAKVAFGHGFADPVLGAQRVFRVVLDALAEPGRPRLLAEAIEAPAGLHPASAQVLLTLADYETPVWLAPTLGRQAGAWMRFHCGAPLATQPAAARFAVLDGAQREPGIAAFDAGEDRFPDKSATLIVQVAGLDGGASVTLSGPGIRGEQSIAPHGLHAGFWAQMTANHGRYPLGVDVILAAGDTILGLPRTTQIRTPGESR